jgi:hypothetical protein
MSKSASHSLRKELTDYVENERTHIAFAKAMRDLPEKLINKKPNGLPYTFWGAARTRPHRPA